MNRFARKLAIPLCFAMLVGVACGKDKKNNASKSTTTTKADIKVGAIFDLSGATADVENSTGRRQVPSQHRRGDLELDDTLVPFEPLPLAIAERGVVRANLCRVHVCLPVPAISRRA